MADGKPYKLTYFPIFGKAPEIAFALELSGLPWVGEFPENWQEMKGTTSWKCLPILTLPDGEQIGHLSAIMSYIGRKAPQMAGESNKDFSISAQLTGEGNDMLAALLKLGSLSMEDYHAAFTSSEQGGNNKGFTIPVYLQLLEEFHKKCGGSQGKFTATGCTIGECKLFAYLHMLKGVKPDILASFPNVLAFYETFGANPKIQEILETGGKMGGPFHAIFKPRNAPIVANPYNARFQQTMVRIKDPKKSVEFYEKNFGMTLVCWLRFPQWTFTVYFMENVKEDAKVKPPKCTLESSGAECEQYLWNMSGSTLELTHNHGDENDENCKFWSGNTGKDASGPLHAEEPAVRGFGHIAFNCDDVEASCKKLEANGAKFQKKPDEGMMKGLAFVLDPDGYWIEIVKRHNMGWTNEFNLSQTMLRVKDGPAAAEFYCKHLGMTLIRRMDLDQYGFSLFFLVCATEAELEEAMEQDPESKHEGGLDPLKPNSLTGVMWNQCLELTWNHGTEKDPDFHVHVGNSEPKGFGHVGFLVDNLEESCKKMEENGAKFKKRPHEGNMRGIAFMYDADGYWIELVDRKASYKGVCENIP